MPTSTTDVETIREAQEVLINALAPLSHATTATYKSARDEVDFRDWCENNPVACFRRYTIKQVGDSEPGEVSGLSIEEITTNLELTVAYPKTFGKFGPKNSRSMRATIDKDAMQLRNTIGSKGFGDWVAGQLDSFDVHTFEDGEAVSFLIITLETVYYRSMT